MGDDERSEPGKNTNLKIDFSSEGRGFPLLLIPQEGPECSLRGPDRMDLDCRRPNGEICKQCSMMEFVPSEQEGAKFPCHPIPLNAAGDTIALLHEQGNVDHMERLVFDWLRCLPSNKKRLAWESGLLTVFLQGIHSREES